METTQPSSSHPLRNSPADPLRANLVDALRFWEPRRLIYNAILAAATISWFATTWPHFRPALHLQYLLPLTGLALIANVLYCAAYLVDLPLQLSAFNASWKRYRWLLWLAGMLFAFVLTNYWIADEVYPDVH